MFADVGAELVAGVTRGFGIGDGGVDLVTDAEADGIGFGKACVVAAGVERGGELEERLTSL